MVALPTAPATASGTDADMQVVGRSAAAELARLLPSTVPLEVAPYDPASAPAADAVAVTASFVGGLSAELVVVAQDAVADALAGSDAAISLADALRPALEAASATLGAGVLDEAQSGPLDGALDTEDVIVHALVAPDSAGGSAPQAWFGLRVRRSPEPVPHQRGPVSAAGVTSERAAMRLLHDVEMVLTAEIGRTKLPVRQVLELVPGTVLELDRTAGSPADVMVNGRLVARGEVVVVDEDYGIRITEIVATEA